MFDDPSYNEPVKLNEKHVYQCLFNYLYYINGSVSSIKTFQNTKTNQFKIVISSNNAISYFYCLDESLKLHKENGPAMIHVDGSYRYEYYYENNIPHRINGPQEIHYHKNKISFLIYKVNGAFHREDGPTYIGYRKDGKTKSVEQYYCNNKVHREDGPAYTYYNKLGEIQIERWYKNNSLHRLDGPADIIYKNKKPTRKLWYVNNKQLDKTKLPIFENGQLCGTIKLSGNTIIKATLFDREYGMFLKEMYDKISK